MTMAIQPTDSYIGAPSRPVGSIHAENAACAVEIALAAEGIRFDPAEIARTASRVVSDLGASRHALVHLAAAAVEHGLTASALRSRPSDLIERLDEGVTLVIHTEDDGFLVLSAPTGSSLCAAYRIADGAARRVRRSPERMLRDMGDDLVDALTLEASFPLDVLRTPGRGPRNTFKKLWAFARLERSELTTVFIYAVLIGILTLVVPVSMQALVNTIAFGSVLQPLIILGLALLAGLVLSAVLQTLRHYVVEVMQRRVFARVVNDFGRRIPRWSSSAEQRDLRELSNRFFDIVTLQKAGASLTIDALGLTLQTAVGLLLLAFYHPVLLAFDVVLILALCLLILQPLGKATTTAIAESKAKYATAAWLQAMAEHRDLFGDARGSRHGATRAEALSRTYLERRSEHWRQVLKQVAGGLTLHVIAAVALLLIGGWLVMQRQLTLGQLVASELVVAVIGAGFAKLGKQMEKVYDAAAAIDKVSEVANVERERDGGIQLTSERPATVDLVGLEHARLHETVDLHVGSGECVAITGESASGKTSLLALLLGRLSPDAGTVRIDGCDLERADLRSYRSHLCTLGEDPRMPDMTIAELLRMHAPHASTSHLRDALDAVGLTGAVQRLPNELDQKLLPHGAPLSRTEMLRLHVARLLLQKPRLALIDGTLDALDHEPALLDAVLDGPWTTIVVTGSEAVMARADRTLHLSSASEGVAS